MTAPSRTVPRRAGVHPAVPGYSSMRMVADWASAVRGEQLYFGFDGVHATLEAGPGPGTLPLSTRAFARRPRVAGVEFTAMEGGVPRTLALNGQETSALFWSESAVEKFLFPYLASAAGGAAPSLFRRLAHAWYEYDADEVQVCAVAYECGTARPAHRKRLTLEGMVALVCLVHGKLERVPLKEFRKRFPGRGKGPGVERKAGHLHPESGWPLNGQVENIVARDAAEFVSGLRGHEVVFVADDGELSPWVAERGRSGAGKAGGFQAGMDTVRADRPAPSAVVAYVKDSFGEEYAEALPMDGSDHARVPDSLFWSDGAVEKLLVPYYASVKGLAAPLFTTLLLGKWIGLVRGEPPVQALWAVLAELQGFLGAPADSLTPADSGDGNPYAVTHLPRSEYIPEPGSGGSSIEARTHFLRLGGAGEFLGSVSA